MEERPYEHRRHQGNFHLNAYGRRRKSGAVCTRCGACCRWAGDVCIETDEIREISRFLDMDEQVFIDTCCRLRANRRGLSIRDAEDGACMMLTKDGCRINPVKPRQCRDFPNKWNFPGWRDLCRAREVGEEREA